MHDGKIVNLNSTFVMQRDLFQASMCLRRCLVEDHSEGSASNEWGWERRHPVEPMVIPNAVVKCRSEWTRWVHWSSWKWSLRKDQSVRASDVQAIYFGILPRRVRYMLPSIQISKTPILCVSLLNIGPRKILSVFTLVVRISWIYDTAINHHENSRDHKLKAEGFKCVDWRLRNAEPIVSVCE